MLDGRKVIALCTSRISESDMHEFVVELNKSLIEYNCRLIIYHLCYDYDWLEDYMSGDSAVFDLIDYDVVDALVLMDEKIKKRELSLQVIDNAKQHQIPVVVVDGEYDDCICVRFDFKKGFELIMRHMVEHHGLRDLHFMAGYKNNSFSNERLEVFKNVLEEYGIEFRDDMVSYGDFWSLPTIAATKKLIERGHVPEAIVCANDIMAINVCMVLKEHGYEVPRDVKVTGFDGADEIFFMEPPITSVLCSYRKLANAIQKILLEQLEGKSINHQQFIVPEFVQLESCGCSSEHKNSKISFIERLNKRFYRYQDNYKMLASISEGMQGAQNLEELANKMEEDVFDNISCVFNESCFDYSIGPDNESDCTTYDEKFVVLHSSLAHNQVPFRLSREDLYETMKVLIEKQVPIVLNALCSTNRLLGFACFYFEDMDITTFNMIPQIVISLSSGIRGYMNVQHQRYLQKEMEKIYRYDALTGLYNRMGFNVEFDKMVSSIKDREEYITVFLTDLDRLKYINDKYGHAMGDKAIVTIARALQNACPDTAICVRLGGDEMFAVLVGECDVESIKKNIGMYLEEYNQNSNMPWKVSTSIGVYQTLKEEERNFDYLMAQADKAMYEEKIKHHNDENRG